MRLQALVDLLGEIQYVSGGFLVGGVCVMGLVGNLALFVLLSKQVRQLLHILREYLRQHFSFSGCTKNFSQPFASPLRV